MVYSDTTDKKGIIQDCEFWTGLGDAGISGDASRLDHFTRNINEWYQKVFTMILQSQDEWDFDDANLTSQYPTATRDFVADQRDYEFSTASWSLIGREGGAAGSNAAIQPLKIKRIDFTYDGTNYYRANPFDIGVMGDGDGNDTTTDGRFSKNKPYYDVRSNSIWIYPRASADDVTNGAKMRVIFTREISKFVDTDTTKEPGFDETFHRILSMGASMDWLMAKEPESPRIVHLQNMFNDSEVRLRTFYGSKEKDRNYILKAAYVDYS